MPVTDIAYDCEFLEDGTTIDLISIGMAASDGREYYAVCADANWDRIAGHDWLCENVIPHLPLAPVDLPDPVTRSSRDGSWIFAIDRECAAVKPRHQVANEVRDFICGSPTPVRLWADHGAYDHVCLAQLWGTMARLPDGIPMWTHDLRQAIEQCGILELDGVVPLMPGAVGHHALHDAREVLWRLRWLRGLPAAGITAAVGTLSVLGLPLDVAGDDPIRACTPLGGLVVAKALGADGEIGYYTAATDGVTSVECLGMAELAALKLRRSFAREMAEGEEEPD